MITLASHHSALIMLDIKKAFLIVNHDSFLQKLPFCGIRGVVHNLLSSFLHNRIQFVMINNMTSSFNPISYGLLQNSVSSALLFLLFIYDIKSVTTNKPRLFGDDTCLIFRNPDCDDL